MNKSVKMNYPSNAKGVFYHITPVMLSQGSVRWHRAFYFANFNNITPVTLSHEFGIRVPVFYKISRMCSIFLLCSAPVVTI